MGSFISGLSDLIIVYSVVPAEKTGEGAVSYEEADEKEASNILLAVWFDHNPSGYCAPFALTSPKQSRYFSP